MKAKTLAPVGIGLAMGLMLPLALHGQGALGALLFILGHVAVVIAALVLASLIPTIRHRLRAHRPSLRHAPVMASAVLVGFGVVCLACPLAFGMSHPWT